jgi:hypothetical protein
MPMPISPGTRLLDAGLPSKGGLGPLCSAFGVSESPLPCSLKLRFGDLQTMHTPSKTLQTCVQHIYAMQGREHVRDIYVMDKHLC